MGGGTLSRSKRRYVPNAVTRSGPAQPQTALPGIGGASRLVRSNAPLVISAAAASVSYAVIECHRRGARHYRWPRDGTRQEAHRQPTRTPRRRHSRAAHGRGRADRAAGGCLAAPSRPARPPGAPAPRRGRRTVFRCGPPPPGGGGVGARRFAELAGEPRTLIFFESRRRLAQTLTGVAEAFGGGRPAVVCRELTKTHEE